MLLTAALALLLAALASARATHALFHRKGATLARSKTARAFFVGTGGDGASTPAGRGAAASGRSAKTP